MKGLNVRKLWKHKNEILEGLKNNIFKTEAVEKVVEERNKICLTCEFNDPLGEKCEVPGTGPCCGACGCSHALKQRCLSCECEKGFWKAVITDEQQVKLETLENKKL
jgi:hypothetical protein